MRYKTHLKNQLSRFLVCEKGATAIEYGLIMALVFLVILGAVTNFSQVATDKMQTASDAIADAGS
ncbi:hypothetical protein MNBD_ALPHA06-2002 [hydrothermal vent metagenome]|uniref:Flp pilus assembly protein, pilin Flp n=1 Tax=hydrothermal vent metagenome TaxID=652676 RepID=A0A3B0T1K4_9ZZZZ